MHDGTTVSTREIDPRAKLVDEIFGWFEEREDRAARIVCGGTKHLRALQRQDGFEPALPDEHPREEPRDGVPKGTIFGARVYRSKQLAPNVIHVEGAAFLPGTTASKNTCVFIDRRGAAA